MEVEPAAFASAGKLSFLTSSIHCPPFQLNDASMAASAEESGSEKVMKLQQSIQVHETAKRIPTVNLRDIPRIWQTSGANVTQQKLSVFDYL